MALQSCLSWDHFPKNTELYRIMTTKPQELKKKEDE